MYIDGTIAYGGKWAKNRDVMVKYRIFYGDDKISQFLIGTRSISLSNDQIAWLCENSPDSEKHFRSPKRVVFWNQRASAIEGIVSKTLSEGDAVGLFLNVAVRDRHDGGPITGIRRLRS